MPILELLVTLLAPPMRLGPPRDSLPCELLARGALMLTLMHSMAPMATALPPTLPMPLPTMAMALLVLLDTPLAPPLLPGLPRDSEARGQLMLMPMLTTMVDMDMGIPLHTEDMDMAMDTAMAVDTSGAKLLCS